MKIIPTTDRQQVGNVAILIVEKTSQPKTYCAYSVHTNQLSSNDQRLKNSERKKMNQI